MLVLVLVSGTGCPSAAGTVTATPSTESGTTSAATAAVPATPDGVYFAIDDRVVRLGEDGGFTTIATPGPIVALALGPAGRLLAVADTELLELGGDGFVSRLAFDPGLGKVEQVAITTAGIWAIGSSAIGLAEAGRWTLSSKLDRKVDDFASATPLHLLVGDRVLRFEGPEALVELAIRLPFAHATELAVASSGRIAIAGATCELAVVDPSDSPESKPAWARSRNQTFGCEVPTALALDGHDRIWVASSTGLHVVDSSGTVQAYPTGSVVELVGVLRSIAILGEGLAELPSAGLVQTGGIAGKLEFRGKPAARTKLEICPRPAPIFHASPCDHSLLRFSTTTSADGSFAFEAVPLARYGWALQVGEQWTTTPADAVVGVMRTDQVLDLGTQRLE